MPESKNPVRFRTTAGHRFHLLDALRGVAAILIVIRHMPPYLTKDFPIGGSFLAVDFFFCLSGFVIAFAYEERLSWMLPLRDFAVARLIRLYPLFLFGTLLGFFYTMVLRHALSSVEGRWMLASIGPAFLFLPGFPFTARGGLYPLNIPAWSLFFELVINLAYAALVRKKAATTSTLAAVSLLSFAVLLFCSSTFDVGAYWFQIGIGFARVGFSFPLGILLYRFWSRSQVSYNRFAYGSFAGLLLTVLFTLCLMQPVDFGLSKTIQFATVGLVFPAFVYLGASVRLPQRWNTVSAMLGNLSYPVYVLHYLLMAPLGGKNAHSVLLRLPKLLELAIPVYLLLIVTSCWFIAKYVDVPIRRWLSGVYNDRRATQSAIA